MSHWIILDDAHPKNNEWVNLSLQNLQANNYVLLLNFSIESSVKLRKKLALILSEHNIFNLSKEELENLNQKGNKFIALIIERWLTINHASSISTIDHPEIQPKDFLELYFETKTAKTLVKDNATIREKLAFISPLPPEQTGIANYNEKLLPLLGSRYDITLVVQQAYVSDHIKLLKGVSTIMSAQEFRETAYHFDRLVYHIGNSLYHAWQFDLIKEHPGLAVLHDYFLFDAIWWQENSGMVPQAVRRNLYEQYGFPALVDAETNHTSRGPDHYPVNAGIINDAAGILTHSHHAKQLHRQWYKNYPAEWVHTLPLYRDIPKTSLSTEDAKSRLKINPNTLILSSFGGINAKKGTDLIVDAFLDCPFPSELDVKLILVGTENTSPFGIELKKRIQSHRQGKKIIITGYTNDEQYKMWMHATDIAIQLRKESRGESSGTLFDVMVHQKCAIVNAHGSSAEVPANCVWQLEEEINIGELKQAMLELSTQPKQRTLIANRAFDWIVKTLDKKNILSRYHDAIEKSIEHPIRKEYQWLNKLSRCIQAGRLTEAETQGFIKFISPFCLLERRKKKRILFDISTLAWKDQKTGIERVTRELAIQLLSMNQNNYLVELIQWRGDTYYTHPDFAAKLLNISDQGLTSRPVEAVAGDIYLSVEWSPPILEQAREEMLKMRSRGVRFYFAIHDLLPIIMPQYFPKGTDQSMQRWFDAVSEIADGLLCVSQTVAHDVKQQIAWRKITTPTYITVFNSGADFNRKSVKTSPDEELLCAKIMTSASTRFIMVGTIEPRKGHDQVLAGIEQLWNNSDDISLIIVGKQGWDVENLIQKVKNHPQLNKKLFWLNGCSDGLLIKVYQQSSGLIAASYGEGFGLPLVEAAQYQIPILARDIPIFREVAQEYAEFFRADSDTDMANAIRIFAQNIQTFEMNDRPQMHFQNWEQSAKQLIEQICRDPALCLDSN